MTAFIWWSVATVVTGLARGFAQFYAVRVIFGLGEGVHFPCAFKLNSNWFPNKERATANSVFTSAYSLGPAIAPPLPSRLLRHLAGGLYSIFLGPLDLSSFRSGFISFIINHRTTSIFLLRNSTTLRPGRVKPSMTMQKMKNFPVYLKIKTYGSLRLPTVPSCALSMAS